MQRRQFLASALAGAPALPRGRSLPNIAIISAAHPLKTSAALAAIQSGAHVFIEQPYGPDPSEAVLILKAARASDRVVQIGEPEPLAIPREFSFVRAFAHHPYSPDCRQQTLGHAARYWMLQILTATGGAPPHTVSSTGGRHLGNHSLDTQVAIFEFERFTFEWEHRTYIAAGPDRPRTGALFQAADRIVAMRPDHATRASYAAFLENIRVGKRPLESLERAHVAAAMVQLAAVAQQLQRPFRWDST